MTDNDFDTQRTELANRFASAGAEFLGQMPLAAAALAEVPNTQPQQYAMVGEPKAIRALLPSDDMPARRMRHGQRPTEPLEWEPPAISNKATEEGELPALDTVELADLLSGYEMASGDIQARVMHRKSIVDYFISKLGASRQVANKAEVEPVAQVVKGNLANRLEWMSDEVMVSLPVGTKLYATPPATTGASTVLTDERTSIDTEEFDRMLTYFTVNLESRANLIAHIDQHVAREVAAQAGQVAVPGWISVDERLPELQKEVLIFCGYLVLGYRTDDKHDPENHNGWVIDFDNGMASPITHWMPLPPSPAKESK